MRDDHDQFAGRGVTVLPISVDHTYSLKEYKAKYNMQVDMLSDFKRDVSRLLRGHARGPVLLEPRVLPDRRRRGDPLGARRSESERPPSRTPKSSRRSIACRRGTARRSAGRRCEPNARRVLPDAIGHLVPSPRCRSRRRVRGPSFCSRHGIGRSRPIPRTLTAIAEIAAALATGDSVGAVMPGILAAVASELDGAHASLWLRGLDGLRRAWAVANDETAASARRRAASQRTTVRRDDGFVVARLLAGRQELGALSARPGRTLSAGRPALSVDRRRSPRAGASRRRVRAPPRVRGRDAHARDRRAAPIHREDHRLAARRSVRDRSRVSHSGVESQARDRHSGRVARGSDRSHDLRDLASPAGRAAAQRVRETCSRPGRCSNSRSSRRRSASSAPIASRRSRCKSRGAKSRTSSRSAKTSPNGDRPKRGSRRPRSSPRSVRSPRA